MKKLFAVTLFLSCFAHAFSQTRLTIRTSNEADFLLFINDEQVNNKGVISLTVDNILTPKTTLKAVFPAQPDKTFSQQLTLKKNTSVFYDIEEVKGVYKFVLKSESTIVINTTKNDIVSVPSNIEMDSASIESIQLPAAENDLCPTPIKEGALLSFVNELMAVHFEAQKLSKMKNFVTNNCITVDQLEVLLLHLSMEDNKLELLQHSVLIVHDPSNLEGVENNFVLARNKQRAREIVNNWKK